MVIDLNCDMGEGFGRWSLGADADVLPVVTSANIACGFHAGDPQTMQMTVAMAHRLRVGIGAHPGYPDLQGFGRRAMDLSPSEVEAAVLYQIGALHAFAQAVGGEVAHVKAHGALYNYAARHLPTAQAIARAVARFDSTLILVALANSEMVVAGEEYGLAVAREAFADRAYQPDGTLRSRTLPHAVYEEPELIVNQAIAIARDGAVTASDGSQVALQADTLCLHGDTSSAAELARAIRSGLERAGISIVPLRKVLEANRIRSTT